MENLKALSVFHKRHSLTRQEKIEYVAITVCGIILALTTFWLFTPVYAEVTSSDMASIVKTILKAICMIVGSLFTVIGVIKFAISHANEDGPAQQKAIMMMATGILLVAIGLIVTSLIDKSWFEVKVEK